MDPIPNDRPSIPRQSPPANDPETHAQTQHTEADNDPSTRCCCGSECAEHGLALKSLEKDVRDAARVGQALLVRHETYIAESEAERSLLTGRLARLEEGNRTLETRNAQLVAQNSTLLKTLDDVESHVHESDVQVQSLTTTLHSTQRDLEKMTRLAARTESLEAQLLECEKEQARLQATLVRSTEEERAAVQRWRNIQRRVVELEEQLEDIEKEAREERTRHEQVEARFENRRAVERELDASVAVAAGEGSDKRGNEVVSSFVKEILQDNANMQIAMVELQDLLAYYKEAELLQGNLKQSEQPEELDRLGHPSLSEELATDQDQPHRQVHVHHHYHAPSTTTSQRQPRSKSQQAQRPKKRRPALVSGQSTPLNVSRSPHRPPNRHRATTSTASSVGSFDHRVSKSNRWSVQSTQSQSSFAVSSGPSSPRSTAYCPSTIFEQDLADRSNEYSRPTSPESNAVWSPSMRPVHRALGSSDSSFQPLFLSSKPAPEDIPEQSVESSISTIKEINHEQDPGTKVGKEHPPQDEPPRQVEPTPITFDRRISPPASPTRKTQSPRRHPRRTDSHASLISISGMDIHSSFPSPARPQFHTQALDSRQKTGAILTAATASAIKAGKLNSHGVSSESLRGRLGQSNAGNKSMHYSPLTDTLGKRLGGWLTTRWAAPPSTDIHRRVSEGAHSVRSERIRQSPISEAEEHQEESAVDRNDTSPVEIVTKSSTTNSLDEKLSLSTSPRKLGFRPPGVNQNGGLPPLPLPGGFRSIGRTPITKMVDEDALRECLEDDPDPQLRDGNAPPQLPPDSSVIPPPA